MEISAKGLRVTEMAHTVKSQRDEYYDAKRQSAEMRIFRELRKISKIGRETYFIARQNKAEISNIKKCLDGFQTLMETIVGKEEVEAAIVKQELEPIPETPELEEQARRLDDYLEDYNEEHDSLNGTLVIDENLEDSVIVDELYEGVWNPDSSVVVDEVVPLTKKQIIDKERRLDVEEKLKAHNFQNCDNEGWSFERYVELQDEVQKAWSPVTISKPINPAVFRKRYGRDWDESMTLHCDFGGSRGEGPRVQKPKGWEERRDKERAAKAAAKAKEAKDNAKAKLRVKPKTSESKPKKDKGIGKKSSKPSDPSASASSSSEKYQKHAPTKTVKTKAELKFIQEDNPADKAKIDEVFDSDSSSDDFQMERSPIKLRGQEKLRAAKRKAEGELVASTSKPCKKPKLVEPSVSRQIAKYKIIPQ